MTPYSKLASYTQDQEQFLPKLQNARFRGFDVVLHERKNRAGRAWDKKFRIWWIHKSAEKVELRGQDVLFPGDDPGGVVYHPHLISKAEMRKLYRFKGWPLLAEGEDPDKTVDPPGPQHVEGWGSLTAHSKTEREGKRTGSCKKVSKRPRTVPEPVRAGSEGEEDDESGEEERGAEDSGYSLVELPVNPHSADVDAGRTDSEAITPSSPAVSADLPTEDASNRSPVYSWDSAPKTHTFPNQSFSGLVGEQPVADFNACYPYTVWGVPADSSILNKSDAPDRSREERLPWDPPNNLTSVSEIPSVGLLLREVAESLGAEDDVSSPLKPIPARRPSIDYFLGLESVFDYLDLGPTGCPRLKLPDKGKKLA